MPQTNLPKEIILHMEALRLCIKVKASTFFVVEMETLRSTVSDLDESRSNNLYKLTVVTVGKSDRRELSPFSLLYLLSFFYLE
jgi:hypothetical protein